MSWTAARDEALKLVDRLQLKNEDIKGKRLDIEALLPDLPYEGRYRVMILQAAARLLEHRGAIVPIHHIAKREIPKKETQ